ncbi:MAG: hypothetical protein AB8G96_03665 [Phycisphaerales bacterium]
MSEPRSTDRSVRRRTVGIAAATVFAAAVGAGCGGGGTDDVDPGGASAAATSPSFTLAWSEYPSWSAFGVAEQLGLIDGERGKRGSVEEAHNVDIVLRLLDYDACLQAYGTGSVDAVCITNMDVLAPALGRPTVAVLPTSRSVGADALIVTEAVADLAALKSIPTYGLSQSVSEYCFVRNLELLGEDPADYEFVNRDPGAAAQAMMLGSGDVQSIVVWNPFVLQTLERVEGSRRLFDSSSIPGEILDLVAMSRESLESDGGTRFVRALADAFFQIGAAIEDPATRNATLVALGEKFSSLDAEAMAQCVEETAFYGGPAEAEALFGGDDLPAIMERVVGFCVDRDIVDRRPVIGFGPDATGDLVFDASHLAPVTRP